jgi:two-component system phosphate regulon sensor histidine kinase PhoR
MQNSTIIRVVLFGMIAIIGIIGIQVHLLMENWDEKEQQFHEKAVIALSNVAQTFEKMGSPLPAYDFVKRVSSNYYVVNINDEIDPNSLDYFLRKELDFVQEAFEYRIYDCETEEMVFGNYIGYTIDDNIDTTAVEKEQLPVLDGLNYFFGVRFPNRTQEIISSMRLTIVFAAILLITMLFFIYTIYVILMQKRLSEMQKDFINNMTHEFKTPISTIKISSDVFLNNENIQQDKRLFQYAKIIKEQNQRLNNQVEKVLQLARIERGNFKLNKEELDLHEILGQIMESTQLKVGQQNGQLTADLQAKNTTFAADKFHLINIIHNILDNATKYCKDAPQISIQTKDSGKDICLKISDKGIGISKEYLPKIFNKFYRVPTGNVHNVKGFGLGLFYIKNICEAHGWKLDLQSEENVGTEVSILLKK